MSEITHNKTDVIVVGGGPAGISCAITIARAGKEVILIERGSFSGSKTFLAVRFMQSQQEKSFRILKQKRQLSAKPLNISMRY